ncbi:unnamed protein product [Haemonchus placei]|uniref:Secreted protein n=1 Tax=Haemonchus placei TaxID=6290 RepID=A0A0N4W595_HAEPC|nr:unnamed protein product [Haemonchus placei]
MRRCGSVCWRKSKASMLCAYPCAGGGPDSAEMQVHEGRKGERDGVEVRSPHTGKSAHWQLCAFVTVTAARLMVLPTRR